MCVHTGGGAASLTKETPKRALPSEAGAGRDETRRGHSGWMRARTSSSQGARLPPAPSLQALDFGPLSSPLCLLGMWKEKGNWRPAVTRLFCW